MRVSVALCTHNGQAYLQDQLDSYLNQTRIPDELVVCDDLSSDETLTILQEFARTAPFTVRIYRNKEQLGCVKNFEKAVVLCDGDIIFFSDQDDVWDPEKIELMAAALENTPNVGVTFCNAKIVDRDLRPTGRTLWEMFHFNERLQKKIIQGRAEEVLIKMDLFWGLTIAFRSKYRNMLLPFFPGVGHDTWTAMLIALVSDISIVQKPLVEYRQHSSNVHGVKEKTLRDVLTTTALKSRQSSRLKGFNNRVTFFEALKERLLQIGDVPDLSAKIGLLERKIAHFRRRANMSPRRLFRVHQVLSELVTLQYHFYSRGLRDFIRDLLERDRSV